MTGSSRARAGVVIVRDGHVALIERHREGRHYFVFPGGGVEAGETPAEAAVREAHEELGVDVRLGEIVLELDFAGPQTYFAAQIVGGEFGTGTMISTAPPAERAKRGSYRPLWVSLDDLPRLDVRPPELVPLLARCQTP